MLNPDISVLKKNLVRQRVAKNMFSNYFQNKRPKDLTAAAAAFSADVISLSSQKAT
jgi:hypothetical protein